MNMATDKMNERETRDFMNVESFSQLPFIRPTPTPVKDHTQKTGFKLFGKEVSGSRDYYYSSTNNDDSHDSADTNTNNNTRDHDPDSKENDAVISESSRKFECHYCCRNFPTSQALGGHQNAHKRERQNAKRAHLQSSIVHGGLTDAHVYGLMTSHSYRLNSTPMNTYQPWSNTTTSSTHRYYGGGHGSSTNYSQQPITGNPLAFWRNIPNSSNSYSSSSTGAYNRDNFNSGIHQQQALFFNEESSSLRAHNTSSLSVVSGNSRSMSRLGYEPKPSMQDQVSLDLHL